MKKILLYLTKNYDFQNAAMHILGFWGIFQHNSGCLDVKFHLFFFLVLETWKMHKQMFSIFCNFIICIVLNQFLLM